MKYLLILTVLLLIFLFIIADSDHQKQEDMADVYFTSEISPQSVMKVFAQISDGVKGKVGIKVHFGEEGNKSYLSPELVKELTLKLEATLIETNVLYVGKRRYTESHIKLAREHGFDFAPIDILDAEGDKIIPVDYKHYQEVRLGSHIDDYDSFVIFSHFKGHGMAGFGGAIKNISMGLASVSGKMALHASSIPVYRPESCIQCGRCVLECPGNAITINPLVIDPEKCIGCGKCIGICPVRSFSVPWGSTEQSVFLERLVEYSKAVIDNYQLVYINVLANITRSCDCNSWPDQPFMEDIGILASTDIVAIEKASHDLVDQFHQCDDTFLKENSVSGKGQIEYAHKLGLGNKNYQLINLDK